MDYTKTTWKTGDVITAEKMNNLEDGVEDLAKENTELKSDLVNNNVYINYSNQFEKGGIDANTGLDITSSTAFRIRGYIDVTSNVVTVLTKVDRYIRIIWYNAEKTLLSTKVSEEKVFEQTFYAPKDATYYRIVLGHEKSDIPIKNVYIYCNYLNEKISELYDSSKIEIDTRPYDFGKIYAITDGIKNDIDTLNSYMCVGVELTFQYTNLNVGTQGSMNRAVYIPVSKGFMYFIEKSVATNRTRISLTDKEPNEWELNEPVRTILNLQESSNKSECFYSDIDGYAIITYSNIGEKCNFNVVECSKVDWMFYDTERNEWTKLNKINELVERKMPIDANWDKWNDVRYYYGFDKTKQPIFNTFNGVLESDTMISVRGGKGRWNHDDKPESTFVSGGHVFEGWSGNEKSRLTMLIGKLHEMHACIQVYSPAGLYESNRRFGWLKLGSDEKYKGVDISQNWTKFYTPLTLANLNSSDVPTQLTDADLNPQFTSNSIPIGTMYYDTSLKKVRVYTDSGWKSVAFE